MTEKTTNLKLNGFSIEVEEDPVTLLMQTDQGSFSVEIPKAQLAELIYALRFVSYAQEPLRKKRERRQLENQRLYSSPGFSKRQKKK